MRTKGKAKGHAGATRRVITMTTSQVEDLIVGLYNLGARILHERSPRMTVAMVRAVFERRLGSEQPAAMAALERHRGRVDAASNGVEHPAKETT